MSNPHFGVSDVDLLPTTLLPPVTPKEDLPQEELSAASLGELLNDKRIEITGVSTRMLGFRMARFAASVRELLRGLHDEDGLEELLVSYYLRAVGGTLGGSSVGVLRNWPRRDVFVHCLRTARFLSSRTRQELE